MTVVVAVVVVVAADGEYWHRLGVLALWWRWQPITNTGIDLAY